MRKSTWSILIWTVFVGLFIAIFFITFQSRLELFFAQSREKNMQWEVDFALSQALDSLRSDPVMSLAIGDGVSLRSNDFDGLRYRISLPAGRATELRLTSTGGMTSLSGAIISGWPVRYIVASVPGGVTSSGVIFSSGSIGLTDSTAQIIYLENLGGHLVFSLDRGSSDLTPVATHYSITRPRGDIVQTLWNYRVSHFSPGAAFSGAVGQYPNYGMYLNVSQYEQ